MLTKKNGSVRPLWLVPVVVVAVVLGLFAAIALTRGGLDQDRLAAHLLTNGAIYLALVAAAFIAFRALRRTRAPQAMDEARSVDREG